MALVNALPPPLHRPRALPPPLPVSLRLDTQPWHDVPGQLLLDLRLNLTNHVARGDRKDDGEPAGSLFRELIDDHNIGLANSEGWWIVTCWPDVMHAVQPRALLPVAWMLMRPEARYLRPTFRVGAYTHPSWRQRGVGKLLNNEAVRLAHRLGYKRLVAVPWNAKSTSFFRSVGYDTPYGCDNSVHSVRPVAVKLDVPDACPARLPWRCRPPEKSP
jgi:GNAT superfamily N-acetyltransferase